MAQNSRFWAKMAKLRNQKYPMDLEKLAKNTTFGPKWPFLDCFSAKEGKMRFFGIIFFGHFFKTKN